MSEVQEHPTSLMQLFSDHRICTLSPEGKLTIDLTGIKDIEIVTENNLPFLIKFAESLVLSSNKNIALTSNFNTKKDKNKYKIWLNPQCRNSEEPVHPEDIDDFAHQQMLLEQERIKNFTYSRHNRFIHRKPNMRKVKRRGGCCNACCN